jgi:hypothetical protein
MPRQARLKNNEGGFLIPMVIHLLHDSFCWLLSAVLLLTNGWPVAIQHAHDVGGNPYHHSHREIDFSLRQSSVGEAGAMSGITEHVHLLWLGWEVTLLPMKGCRPSPCPSAAAVGILAQLVEKDSTTLAELEPVAPAVADTYAPAIVLPLHVAVHIDESVCRVAALPLCATARHLRSGVQLI